MHGINCPIKRWCQSRDLKPSLQCMAYHGVCGSVLDGFHVGLRGQDGLGAPHARGAQQQQRLQQLRARLAHGRLVIGAAPARQAHQTPHILRKIASFQDTLQLEQLLSSIQVLRMLFQQML